MRCPRGWPTFLIVGGLALVLDLATKEAIFAQLGMPGMGRRIEFVPGIFVLETNLNEGWPRSPGSWLLWPARPPGRAAGSSSRWR